MMKERTKQLQSLGETRKTNRTWHFLSTLNSLLLSKLLLLLIIPAIGSTAAWADVATIDGTNLNVTVEAKTVDDIQLSVPSSGGFGYSSGLNAGGAGKTFILTPLNGANITQVVITMTGTDNRFTAGNITNCTSATRSGSVYTCVISDGSEAISFKNNGGGVTITKLEVTYTSAGSTPPLSSIAVSTEPTKTTYTAGETFNPAGLVITKTMSDSSTSDVAYSGNEDDFTFSPTTSTALDASNTSVTITYGGKTTNQAITVNRITNTLALSTTSGSMTVGDDDKNISGYITSKNNTGTTVTYSSDAEGVATVTSSGAIHAVSAGTAHITVAQTQTDVYTAGSATYTVTVSAAAPSSYTVYSDVSPAGAGTVEMRETSSTGTEITSGSSVAAGTPIYLSATPATGYQWSTWSIGTESPDNPYIYPSLNDNKTFKANFTAKTYTITLAKNGGSANGYATATFNSNKLTGIAAPTYSGKVVEGYYKEAACTNKIADASGNLVASTDYTTSGSLWKNDAAVTLYAKWVDISYTPFDLSTSPVIDFSESKWSDATASALFDAANVGNGANTPINDVVFRGQTSGDKKAFTIKDGKLVMDVGNGQSGNRWFAIPVTKINGRIDVYIETPYAKGTSFSVKAVLDKDHATTVGTSASNLNAVQLDYVDNYLGTGKGAFHFRIKDLKVSEGVLYIGRNGSSWTTIEKITLNSTAVNFTLSSTSVSVGDAGTQEVTFTNNTAYDVLVDGSSLDTDKATYVYDSANKKITFTGVSAGDAGNIKVYLDINANGSYDSATESETMQTVTVTVNGLSWSTNLNTTAARYTTRGTSATNLSVNASNSPNYQWYKNSKASTAGATAISGATSKTYTPSTDFDEDLSYYYCVASKSGYKDIVSNIKPVLTTVSKRTFWMNTITRRSTTSESELALTNGEDVNIYGGTATFEGNGSEFHYVYVYDDAFFQVGNDNKYYKIELSEPLAAGMTITIGINGLGGNNGGIWLSKVNTRSGASSSKVEFVGDGTESATTKQYTVKAGDAIEGATILYVWSKRNSNDYFGPLYITEALPLTVSAATPASQTVQEDVAATAIMVSASGGVPDYHYQWYQDTSATGSFTTTAVGTGNNTASFTPSTASTGTLYYRCTVTDSKSPTSATVNSSVVSVEVKAKVDYYVIKAEGETGGNAYFDKDGVYDINGSDFKTMYTSQGTSKSYWVLESSNSTYFNDNNLDFQSSKYVQHSTFYVKGAVAFRIIGASTTSDCKYDVTVDGTSQGTYTTNSSKTDSPLFMLNKNGSVFKIDHNKKEVKIAGFIFYEKLPTTLTIQKDGANIEEDIIYVDDAATRLYDVVTNGDGTIGATPTIENPTGGTVVSSASYADGVLTITKGSYAGTATITVSQTVGTNHAAAEAKLTVTLKKHTLAISVSSTEVTLDAVDCGKADDVIAPAKLPTFTVTKDGEPYTPAAGEIKYISDDNSVAYLSKTGDYSSTTYSVKYGGGQGGPTIIAYIDETPGCTHANNSYTLHITQGTDNFISKDLGTVKVQQVYPMDDANGVTVVKLVYGGYKYNSNTLGSTADKWEYYTGAKNAKMDGYTYNRRNKVQNAKSEDKVEILSDPIDDRIWYKEGDTKDDGGGTYAANERIKPFAMPCAGSYLMFEVKKTGILTAYVLQNGIVGWDSSDDGKIATNPRLGYWIDQDGWVQHPTSVVSKAVISDGNGRDQHDYSGKTYPTEHSLKSVNFYGSDKDNPSLLYKQLTYKYCDNADEPTDYYETSGEGHTAINPYYWPKETESADGDVSIDANRAKQVPRKIRPIPYRNGYLMIEEGYLKYTLPVKAGQKYYFLGCGTRIGYVAMNFVENKDAFGANTIDYVEDNVDLKGSDDWTSPTVRTGFTKPTKPTVYSQMTLKRNFTPNQWNTICLPFAVSEKDVEEIFGTGTKLCLYNGLTKKGGNAYVINFMRHVNQDILPGQPYFIYPTGEGVQLGSNGKIGGTTGVEFYDVLVDPAKLKTGINYGSDNDREDGATEKNNEIRYKAVATLAPTAMKQNGFYINTNNGALMKYTPSSDLTVNTYRTFLQPNDLAGTNYSALSLDADLDVEDVSEEGDVPTMIIVVGEDKAEIVNGKLFDGKAYNLMGQEVDAANAKGMVIVNGKKYFRK